jgi:hypothetical protein
LGEVLVVFFSSFLFFVPFLFIVPTGPLFFSSLYVFCIFFSLFNSPLTQAFNEGDMERVVWMEILQARGCN